MEFVLLVQKIHQVTGIDLIMAVRLVTANLMIMTDGDTDIASIDDEVPEHLARALIEIARASMGDHLDLMMG